MTRFIALALILLVLTSCKKEEVEIIEDIPEETGIVLAESIGLSSAPTGADSICDIPLYTVSDYDINAIAVGTLVPDFTLYNTGGQPTTLSIELDDGLPILIVSGSYTCPVFRGKVAALNQIKSDYADQIKVLLVYIVEPHPDLDISPYRGSVWTTSANRSEGILYRQPVTYQDRIDIINAMLTDMTIDFDILIDGPCNEFWLEYGEAPNRAYLIDKNGYVSAQHGWFNTPTMISSIDALLAS